MKEITLILVDDHQLILTGLMQMLAEESGIRIIRSFTNAKHAHQFLEQHDVDIVVTDLDMPNFTGIELIKGIRQLKPQQKIIVLSMIDQRSIINRMINYDVNGYLMKNDAQAELPAAIRKVYAGEHYYNVDIRSMLFKDGEKAAPPSRKIPRLSTREKEVLILIIAEMTTPEIAKELFISQGTVISHRKRILSKLGAKNSAGVVRIALEMGLV